MEKPTQKQVEGFLSHQGKRATLTLSILGKNLAFVKAMKSDIGKEILSEDISRHEELLTKIYMEETTPQELAEFRYLKLRITKIAAKIDDYIKKTQEILED